ncbi:ketopantoate hydroxymethyltransferase [Xylanibacillus composti]|uniref:Ketopantoate hydroxymethyltransferase n=1 Tax=Xylanibacillus composti TaxID=1572762 RepID=A0A8J4M4K8_9BACL|nr:ketopantoate hydroxymethyltransferase [Xylanibacillus composti]MDT9723755.1 ketopantoate hydroxymethyltransferase [Xylanibacillus composti]GIQ70776.1 hypothetical protein XYCOK13_36000 [Xylanibacillus composti]
MIEAQFLRDLASYVNSRIAKVIVNGSYEITNFTVKRVDDQTVVLNYIVPAAEVSLVTEIDLRDTADRVISSKPVHVPITTDHLMLQTLKVKEVTT